MKVNICANLNEGFITITLGDKVYKIDNGEVEIKIDDKNPHLNSINGFYDTPENKEYSGTMFQWFPDYKELVYLNINSKNNQLKIGGKKQ